MGNERQVPNPVKLYLWITAVIACTFLLSIFLPGEVEAESHTWDETIGPGEYYKIELIDYDEKGDELEISVVNRPNMPGSEYLRPVNIFILNEHHSKEYTRTPLDELENNAVLFEYGFSGERFERSAENPENCQMYLVIENGWRDTDGVDKENETASVLIEYEVNNKAEEAGLEWILVSIMAIFLLSLFSMRRRYTFFAVVIVFGALFFTVTQSQTVEAESHTWDETIGPGEYEKIELIDYDEKGDELDITVVNRPNVPGSEYLRPVNIFILNEHHSKEYTRTPTDILEKNAVVHSYNFSQKRFSRVDVENRENSQMYLIVDNEWRDTDGVDKDNETASVLIEYEVTNRAEERGTNWFLVLLILLVIAALIVGIYISFRYLRTRTKERKAFYDINDTRYFVLRSSDGSVYYLNPQQYQQMVAEGQVYGYEYLGRADQINGVPVMDVDNYQYVEDYGETPVPAAPDTYQTGYAKGPIPVSGAYPDQLGPGYEGARQEGDQVYDQQGYAEGPFPEQPPQDTGEEGAVAGGSPNEEGAPSDGMEADTGFQEPPSPSELETDDEGSTGPASLLDGGFQNNGPPEPPSPDEDHQDIAIEPRPRSHVERGQDIPGVQEQPPAASGEGGTEKIRVGDGEGP